MHAGAPINPLSVHGGQQHQLYPRQQQQQQQQQQQLTEAELRQIAANSGYGYRGSGQPVGTLSNPRILGQDFVRPGEARSASAHPSSHGAPSDEASVLSTATSGNTDGFGSLTPSEQRSELRVYIEERLVAMNKGTQALLDLLLKYMPPTQMCTKSHSTVTRSFPGLTKGIRPYAKDNFISFTEWWKQLNNALDAPRISIRMRFDFLKSTGGLPPKVDE